MVSHSGRLYALALGLVVFFLAWAVVAAHPWGTTAADPRLKALAVRETQLRREARLVDRIVALRWAAYRSALRARRLEIAAVRARASRAVPALAAPSSASVRVVTLPPLTITRTS
jgi:hypothetical protein